MTLALQSELLKLLLHLLLQLFEDRLGETLRDDRLVPSVARALEREAKSAPEVDPQTPSSQLCMTPMTVCRNGSR